jgi:hypothetical protein
MRSGLDFFMAKALEPVDATPGQSGYFTTPQKSLDPHLFPGGKESAGVRPEIRKWILDTLYGYWEKKYSRPRSWSTVWIAGSGISYQWAGARGNGDLDILIGVDFPAFFRYNERFLGLSESDLADQFNTEFKTDLWPQTAHTKFSSTIQGDLKQEYEVTFYVNPHSTDIRDIRPYAAFDLSSNSWTVHPVHVPDDPEHGYDTQWWDAVEDERKVADTLVARYNGLAAQAKASPYGSPGWHNTMRQIEMTTAQAQTLFDSIHLGRKNAFGPQGTGYGDFYNFRWQAHKRFGTVQALHALGLAQQKAREDSYADLYGEQIEPAAVALRRAALWNRGGNVG